MTTTAPEERTLQAVAADNAQWIAGKLEEGDVERLLFLKYRPVRELADVQDAAKRRRLVDVVAVLDDAIRLAKGHTGGPAAPSSGYEPIVYPVTEDEVALLLEETGRQSQLLALPGADRGWTWSRSVECDPETVTVTVTFQARHPRLRRDTDG